MTKNYVYDEHEILSCIQFLKFVIDSKVKVDRFVDAE